MEGLGLARGEIVMRAVGGILSNAVRRDLKEEAPDEKPTDQDVPGNTEIRYLWKYRTDDSEGIDHVEQKHKLERDLDQVDAAGKIIRTGPVKAWRAGGSIQAEGPNRNDGKNPKAELDLVRFDQTPYDGDQ